MTLSSSLSSALLNRSGGDGLAGVDARVEFAGAVPPRHLAHRNDLDLACVSGGAELLESFAAQIAHRIQRGFQEFTWVELGPRLRGDFAEHRGHRQPAVGVYIDLAHAALDAADDLFHRHAPGLRHLAAELVEHVL